MRRVLIIIMVILFISVCYTLESHYTREAKVTTVNCIEVTVEDNQGFEWSFCGEGYQVGQMVTLKMSDNHTDIITDDIIIDVE